MHPSHPPHLLLLLLLIHCGLLAGEGAAGRGALSGELIAIGIMSADDKGGHQGGGSQNVSQQCQRNKDSLTFAAAVAAAGGSG